MAVSARMTFEEFLRLPETETASEYACGEVEQKPMPDLPHAAIQTYLAAVLVPFLTRTGLGRAFTELRCIFGPPDRPRAYVPDLCYVAKDRLPTERHLHAAPDLAIEVLSPDQSMGHFMAKIHFYLHHGVRLVWVIDPASATVLVLAPGDVEERLLAAGDVLDGGHVLPGFSVPVDDIFAQMQL